VQGADRASATDPASDAGTDSDSDLPPYTQGSFQGRVRWLDEVLRERFKIETGPEGEHTSVVLVTDQGTIHPLVPNTRGRGFMKDGRLRDVELELYVRRYEGSPLLQVIRVYLLREDGKLEVDYWCDVCAITMFEMKRCECCQDDNRLRLRLVESDTGQTIEEEVPVDMVRELAGKKVAEKE
jgi:hypothetical protein